jgi:hypothetical protein
VTIVRSTWSGSIGLSRAAAATPVKSIDRGEVKFAIQHDFGATPPEAELVATVHSVLCVASSRPLSPRLTGSDRTATSEQGRSSGVDDWPERAARRGSGRSSYDSAQSSQRGQSAIWDPIRTVRSLGSPKWSMGLAALRAIVMKRPLRQARSGRAGVGVMVMRETK